MDQEIGFIEDLYGDYTLGTNICNVYGLPFPSARWQGPDEPPAFPIVLPGDTISSDYFTGSYFFFSGVPAPALQTVGYYFARPSVDVSPGGEGFNITNTTPAQIMASFGQYFVINGWAKQAITNGYPDKFAYPEQYFDQAYLADTSGNITTNQTGILSEYGEFFPTQPGKVFLTTLPDGATGSTGTNVVNVIKLQVDANRDGAMDTSFTGPDNTYIYQPYVLWVNNDFDRNDSSGTNQDDFRTASNPGGLLYGIFGGPPMADCNYTNAYDTLTPPFPSPTMP